MLQNRRNLFLEGFLNNVWICAAGGRNPVLAGAGDRKQGERGDFHRGSQHMLVSAGAGEHTIPVRIHNPREVLIVDFPKNRATWRNLDWSGRLLLLVTMHCCGFSDAVSGE